MTLADLPVGREDLLVLLKKLIRFIHIKVQRQPARLSVLYVLIVCSMCVILVFFLP